jgi:uncharacterized protein (DUF1684 family)
MTSHTVSRSTLLLLALALAANHATASAQSLPGQLEQWRKAYADQLDRPDGWLSLVALQWLQDGDTTVGSAPGNKLQLKHVPAHLGVFRQQHGQIKFLPGADGVPASVAIDGKPAAAGEFHTDHTPHPSVLTAGDVQMSVIQRSDRFYLRVKDAVAPNRLHFHGLNWYPPDDRYRITARWVPYNPEKTLNILNVLGLPSEEPSPGYAEFQIDGRTVRLDATIEGNTLFFDLRDATSRISTEGIGRFLNTAFPPNGLQASGPLVLDFNYAHNPPCAYTPYATCPLPPPQNRLDVAIPAGEKRYGEN